MIGKIEQLTISESITADFSWLERQGIKLNSDGSLPMIADDVPARMSLEDEKKQEPILPQFDNEMWFLSILPEREQAAVKLAYEYAKLGQPGLPNHLYLKVIHTLSELLRQIDVEIETNGND